jgi:formylglycine-generating enzyme required for sulfatase activity
MGRVAVLIGSLLLTSCSLRDLDYLERGDSAVAEVSDVAPSDVAETGAACPDPRMVRVDTYCIDATEVTERDYAAFLTEKKGDTSGQPDVCAFNTSFDPDPVFFPKNPNLPVRTVDWCDAYAYCKWSGKRLCGKIGGGALPFLSLDDPELDQWFRACSNGGTRDYPYGNTYDPTACMTNNSGAVVAKSLTKCEGGYPGIFDMSGNVWEWMDSCNDAGECALRGGGWPQEDVAAACAYTPVHYKSTREETAADRGFRCCSL